MTRGADALHGRAWVHAWLLLLPALVLLATGTGAFVAQRRPRRAGNSA